MNPNDANVQFILNGQGSGDIAGQLIANGFNTNSLRPYIGKDGRHYVTRMEVNAAGEVKPRAILTNTNATLRKEEWKEIDTVVMKAARDRLRFAALLRQRGLVYTMNNGLGKTVLETQRMSDPGEAHVNMEVPVLPPEDRPEFDITPLPLPVVSAGFSFGARQIATSRNSGESLDMSMAEAASRRVAEKVEQMAVGSFGTFAYGGGTMYGLRNALNRNTQSLTAPTLTAWTPATLVQEILAMRETSQLDRFYGQWTLFNSVAWDRYLDEDYSASKGDNTLRDRIKKIDGIQDVITLDYLTGYDFLMVQMTSDVVRLVVGMDVTTVQWDTMGGMRKHFLVMAILVPQFRTDINNRSGIVHGS